MIDEEGKEGEALTIVCTVQERMGHKPLSQPRRDS